MYTHTFANSHTHTLAHTYSLAITNLCSHTLSNKFIYANPKRHIYIDRMVDHKTVLFCKKNTPMPVRCTTIEVFFAPGGSAKLYTEKEKY